MGLEVGYIVGDEVGTSVGVAVGIAVGAPVDTLVGELVGTVRGEAVGTALALEQLQFTWKSNHPNGPLPPLVALYSSTKAVVSDPEMTDPSPFPCSNESWTIPCSE